MSSRKGFGLIEIIIASAVISVALVSLSFVFVLANRVAVRATDEIRANFIAEEGIEVMRFLRDKSWSGNLANLSPGTNYYLSFNPATSEWSVVTTNPGMIDNTFTRTITVESVSRDSSDDIVSSDGSIDPDTLKVISTVAWGTSEIVLETYLSDIYDN